MSWGDPPFCVNHSKQANYHTIIMFIPQKEAYSKPSMLAKASSKIILEFIIISPPKIEEKKQQQLFHSTSKWRKQHIQSSHHLNNPSQQPASKAIFRCNWEPGCRAGCWGPPVWRKNQVGSQEMNPWGIPQHPSQHRPSSGLSFCIISISFFPKKTWHMMTWCTNYFKLCIFSGSWSPWLTWHTFFVSLCHVLWRSGQVV